MVPSSSPRHATTARPCPTRAAAARHTTRRGPTGQQPMRPWLSSTLMLRQEPEPDSQHARADRRLTARLLVTLRHPGRVGIAMCRPSTASPAQRAKADCGAHMARWAVLGHCVGAAVNKLEGVFVRAVRFIVRSARMNQRGSRGALRRGTRPQTRRRWHPPLGCIRLLSRCFYDRDEVALNGVKEFLCSHSTNTCFSVRRRRPPAAAARAPPRAAHAF